MNQQPKRLTIKEAAAIKGCCWQTMKLAVKMGQIKSERLGKRIYVTEDLTAQNPVTETK